MIPRRLRSEMETERFFWLLGQVGEAAQVAFNEVLARNTVDAARVVTIARAHDADPVLVLAMLGWLPTDGGWVRVTDPEAIGHRARLLTDAHRWAYVFFEDMARHALGQRWMPYPNVQLPPA